MIHQHKLNPRKAQVSPENENQHHRHRYNCISNYHPKEHVLLPCFCTDISLSPALYFHATPHKWITNWYVMPGITIAA